MDPGSTDRGRGPTDLGHGRLEGFSDAVFALAATLLVVTLEVPSDYDQLLEALARFPAFGLAFAALISLWVGHRQFFARHPLGDGWTVFINAVLLFIVLLYVYPLKLLAEVLANRFFWTSADEIEAMSDAEIQGLYLIFGAAVVATSMAMASLYLRAWQTRGVRRLDPDAAHEVVSEGLAYTGIALIAVVGLGIAAADIGLGWGLPIWLLLIGSPLLELSRQRFTRRRRADRHRTGQTTRTDPRRLRQIAAAGSFAVAAVYGLIAIDVITVLQDQATESAGPPLVAAGAFTILALLLLLSTGRGVLRFGVALQAMAIVMYLLVGAERVPAFEALGIGLKVAQLVLLALFVWLLRRPATQSTVPRTPPTHRPESQTTS